MQGVETAPAEAAVKTWSCSGPARARACLAAAALLAACVVLRSAEDAPPAKPEAGAADKADKRFPVPPAAALADPEKQVKDLFQEDYRKRDPASRAEFAGRLLKLAQESKKDALMYYVLLREARDVALAAGDPDAACAAVDLLAAAFVVDAAGLKVSALSTAARAAATPEAAEKLLDKGLSLLDLLAGDADFDAALKLVTPLEDLARRANNVESARTVQARARDLRAQQAEWAKVKPLADRLKANPDDPEAALAVARHYVVAKGDWGTALPLFSKCAVPALKEAAARDLAQPAEAAACADLGDLWWSLAEKESGPFKAAAQSRAATWYSQALEGLSGLRRLQAEKRVLATAGALGASGEGLKAAGLVFWVNLAADPAPTSREQLSNTPGKTVGPVSVVTDSGTKALKLAGDSYVSYPATDAVKAARAAGSAFVWIKPDKPAAAYTCAFFRGTAAGPQAGKGYSDFALFFHESRLMLWFSWPENTWPGTDGKTAFFSKRPIPPGKWTMVGASWDGTTISIFVNGERDNTYKTAMVPVKRTGSEIIALGCDPAGAPEYFAGLLHGAMIFSRALTDGEVRQLYLKSGLQGK